MSIPSEKPVAKSAAGKAEKAKNNTQQSSQAGASKTSASVEKGKAGGTIDSTAAVPTKSCENEATKSKSASKMKTARAPPFPFPQSLPPHGGPWWFPPQRGVSGFLPNRLYPAMNPFVGGPYGAPYASPPFSGAAMAQPYAPLTPTAKPNGQPKPAALPPTVSPNVPPVSKTAPASGARLLPKTTPRPAATQPGKNAPPSAVRLNGALWSVSHAPDLPVNPLLPPAGVGPYALAQIQVPKKRRQVEEAKEAPPNKKPNNAAATPNEQPPKSAPTNPSLPSNPRPYSTAVAPPTKKPHEPKKKPKKPDQFDHYYKELQEFKKKHGHVQVPTKSKLGAWVSNTRTQYRRLKDGKKSSITMDRLVKLTDVGFVFNPEKVIPLTWDERIEQCNAFIKEHGHLRIPLKHATLGKWTSRIRTQYKRKIDGRDSTLTDERQKQLEDMGFVWLAGQRLPDDYWDSRKSWAERLEDFKEYKKTHGHPFVPQHSPCGLGRWVSEQRKQYRLMQKGEKAAMTAEKALTLTNAGFAWDGSKIRRTPKSALEKDSSDDDESGGDSKSQWL